MNLRVHRTFPALLCSWVIFPSKSLGEHAPRMKYQGKERLRVPAARRLFLEEELGNRGPWPVFTQWVAAEPAPLGWSPKSEEEASSPLQSQVFCPQQYPLRPPYTPAAPKGCGKKSPSPSPKKSNLYCLPPLRGHLPSKVQAGSDRPGGEGDSEPWLAWLRGLSAGLGPKGHLFSSPSARLQASSQLGTCKRQPSHVFLPPFPSV